MRGGYLYAMKYDRKGMYKVNANNVADITWMPFGFTSNFSGGYYGYVQIFKLGDRILGSDFNICSDDTIIGTKNYTETTTMSVRHSSDTARMRSALADIITAA
jgi:hypothetical protein